MKLKEKVRNQLQTKIIDQTVSRVINGISKAALYYIKNNMIISVKNTYNADFSYADNLTRYFYDNFKSYFKWKEFDNGYCKFASDVEFKFIKLDPCTFLYFNMQPRDNCDREIWMESTLVFIGKNREKHYKLYKRYIENPPRWESSDPFINTLTYSAVRDCAIMDQSRVPLRSMDSVFLKKEKKDEIIEFVEDFKNDKQFYRNTGIIYKCGILLYGAPGTGKTSLVLALASMYDIPIIKIKLNDFNGNVNGGIPMGEHNEFRIILIEDIDRAIDGSNIKGNKNITLDSLLNFIDGTNSPNNTIFIITANDISKLPDALIRDGRFDLKVNMDLLNREDAILMCNNFKMPESILDDIEEYPIAAATVMKCIKRYHRKMIMNKSK